MNNDARRPSRHSRGTRGKTTRTILIELVSFTSSATVNRGYFDQRGNFDHSVSLPYISFILIMSNAFAAFLVMI